MHVFFLRNKKNISGYFSYLELRDVQAYPGPFCSHTSYVFPGSGKSFGTSRSFKSVTTQELLIEEFKFTDMSAHEGHLPQSFPWRQKKISMNILASQWVSRT